MVMSGGVLSEVGVADISESGRPFEANCWLSLQKGAGDNVGLRYDTSDGLLSVLLIKSLPVGFLSLPSPQHFMFD